MGRIDEIEAFLDSVHTHVQAIQSSLQPDDAFFHGGHANLEVPDVVGDAVQFFVDPAQVDEDEVVGFVGHAPYSAAIGMRTPSGLAFAE